MANRVGAILIFVMRSRNGKTILAAAAALVLLVSCAGVPDPVRIGTEGAYPPYNFTNDEGEVVGFERELGDELCRRANLNCTWVLNDWDSIIPNLVEGVYDAVLARMGITDERDEVIDFTQPYLLPGPSVYIALSGASDEVLNGTVAARVATLQAGFLSQAGGSLLEYALAEELVSSVLSGEADAALVDLEFAQDSMAEYVGKLTILGPEVMLGGAVGVGVRESDGKLRDKLDRAIDAMKGDGSLNALIDKWFGPDAPVF